jgi:putative ABC transport system permease protein
MVSEPREPKAALRSTDLLRSGALGLHSRRARTLLSALGICIGIAAMVGVLGVSDSSRARLLTQLGQLGNLLTVGPGKSLGADAELPTTATTMIRRVRPVTGAAATGVLADVHVYRNAHIPSFRTGAISVEAADIDLPGIVGARVVAGQFLNNATARFPCVVLGSTAARLLGIETLQPLPQVWLGGRTFTVIGILGSAPISPELDAAALIGFPAAESMFGFDGHAGLIYVRSVPDQVGAVRSVLAATANPPEPSAVRVSRPSDVLAARAAATSAYTALFLGLGAISLIVGAVGIANVMVISVLERRTEIGLRRALGATRKHVALQFVTESVLLSAAGGVMGCIAGAATTAGYALSQRWTIVIPPVALLAGMGAAVVVGTIGGLYPATRAARLTPTDALRVA